MPSPRALTAALLLPPPRAQASQARTPRHPTSLQSCRMRGILSPAPSEPAILYELSQLEAVTNYPALPRAESRAPLRSSQSGDLRQARATLPAARRADLAKQAERSHSNHRESASYSAFSHRLVRQSEQRSAPGFCRRRAGTKSRASFRPFSHASLISRCDAASREPPCVSPGRRFSADFSTAIETPAASCGEGRRYRGCSLLTRVWLGIYKGNQEVYYHQKT